jgi:hypothetical protein
MLMMIFMGISSFVTIVNASALTLELNSEVFEPGETVTVNGTAVAGSELYLTVFFNGSDLMYEDNFTAFEDGNYSASFELDNDAETGSYNVSIASGEASTFTLFTVEPVELENSSIPEPDELENVTTAMVLGEGERLGNSIDRARDYLDRLREIIESLRLEYFGKQDVLDRLDDIEVHINTAAGYLDSVGDAEDHKDAVKNFAYARNLMGKIKGLLTSVFKTHKIEKTEKFTEQVTERIDWLQSKVNKLNVNLANGQETLVAFNCTKLKLSKVMKYLKAGNMSEALDYLEEVVGEIDYNLDNVNGTETALEFKNLYKLEAKIQVLEKKALKLQKKGLDTSAILSSISNVEGQLNQITGNMEKGNKNKDDTGTVESDNGNGKGKGPKDDVVKGYEKPKKNKNNNKDKNKNNNKDKNKNNNN